MVGDFGEGAGGSEFKVVTAELDIAGLSVVIIGEGCVAMVMSLKWAHVQSEFYMVGDWDELNRVGESNDCIVPPLLRLIVVIVLVKLFV